MPTFEVPLIIRGEVIEDYELEFSDRHQSGHILRAPDVNKYMDKLVNRKPASLLDLYSVSLEEIYEYIEELGRRLDFDKNAEVRKAFEVSQYFSNLSTKVLETIYRSCFKSFSRDKMHEMVEQQIGTQYLEGWVPHHLDHGGLLNVRAMGARVVHVIAGNVPVVAAGTFMRSAITRSDAILKLPSNDPLTAVAIAREAIAMAPDHPVTKHFSVAYWKGGDEKVESRLYSPQNIEKICAWGGNASIRHISKYVGPGIDLITLDPKSSTTLIGKEAFEDEAQMRSVAQRLAVDIGGWDQEACSNARVVFIETGIDKAGIERANIFGLCVFDAMQALPKSISNGPVSFDKDLLAEVEAILPLTSFYKVYADHKNIAGSGAIIVSELGEQVDFVQQLYGRVANLIPVDDIAESVSYFTAATQTVGIYPDSLRVALRDRAAVMGGQRFVPVGYAVAGGRPGPHDGIELERRLCKWVSDYSCDVVANPGPWIDASAVVVEAA